MLEDRGKLIADADDCLFDQVTALISQWALENPSHSDTEVVYDQVQTLLQRAAHRMQQATQLMDDANQRLEESSRTAEQQAADAAKADPAPPSDPPSLVVELVKSACGMWGLLDASMGEKKRVY